MANAQFPTPGPVTRVSGHTGDVQLVEADVTNLVSDLAAKEVSANKDAANGYAGLDSNAFLKLTEQCTAINAQTGTSYAIQDGDRAKTITFSNTLAIAATIAQAGTAGAFAAGWFCVLLNLNKGLVTLTPTTSTVNGGLTSVPITRNNGCILYSDGTNYLVFGLLTVDVPSDAYVMTFDGTNGKWVPQALGALGGANASQLRGKNIATAVGSAGSGQDGFALIWVNGDNQFELSNPIPAGKTVAVTTASLASGAIENDSLTMAKMFTAFKVVVSGPARVRLYATSAARTADASRGNTVPPTPGTQHGVLADLYLDTADKYTWMCSPIIPGANNDSPQVATIYAAITNLSTGSAAITVTISYVPQET
jgi:hypothetical protein